MAVGPGRPGPLDVRYIHPFPDGNGRVARFLMNAMLASGGYPWTVIRTEERDEYMAALEAASVDADIRFRGLRRGGGVDAPRS